MPRRLRPTPDGRVIPEPGEDNQVKISPPDPDPRLQALRPFIEACRCVVPDAALQPSARLGYLLFLLGAADRLWCRLELEESRFPALAEALLQQQGLTASEAATLAFALPQVSAHGPAGEALLEGADTLEHWIDGHDSNAVLRLGELLRRWQQDPEAFNSIR